MVDVKISELSNVSSNNLTDLFEISRRLGGDNWESRSTTYHDLVHSIAGQSVITVGSAGACASTIEDGIAHAVDRGVSVTNPIVIIVQPGIYTENPLTVPDYLSIIASGDNNTTYVDAVTTTSPIFTMNNYSIVAGLYFRNANGSGGCGIKGAGTNCVVEDCASSNCETGFYATDSASMRVVNSATINIPGQICTYAYRSDNSASLTVELGIAYGTVASMITNGFYCEGSGSKIFAPAFFAFNCTNGLHSDDGGFIDSDSGYIKYCTNGIRVGSTGTGTIINAFASSIIDSTTYDILIESVTGIIDFSGKYDRTKRSIVSGALFDSYAIDQAHNEFYVTAGSVVEKSMDIGIPGATDVGLDVGEGGSYVNDEQGNAIVEYWAYDASAASGSRFTRYTSNTGTQLIGEGDAIVVGSKFPFSAIRLDITVAANLGSNSIIVEHWNGTTWTEDTICGYKKVDMTHRGTTIFQNIETQYVEFGTAINDDWVSDRNDLDDVPDWDLAIDMYPVRFRVSGGSLTTAMVFDDGRVRGDDFDIKGAKDVVNWGRNRGTDGIFLDSDDLDDDITNPPSRVTLPFSTNITLSNLPEFSDGSISSVIVFTEIPAWADTSTPVELRCSNLWSSADTGNVNLDYIVTRWHGVLGSVTETSYSSVTSGPGVANKTKGISQSIDISSYAPTYKLIIKITRDATASNPLDTYVGDITMSGCVFRYTRKIIG